MNTDDNNNNINNHIMDNNYERLYHDIKSYNDENATNSTDNDIDDIDDIDNIDDIDDNQNAAVNNNNQEHELEKAIKLSLQEYNDSQKKNLRCIS